MVAVKKSQRKFFKSPLLFCFFQTALECFRDGNLYKSLPAAGRMNHHRCCCCMFLFWFQLFCLTSDPKCTRVGWWEKRNFHNCRPKMKCSSSSAWETKRRMKKRGRTRQDAHADRSLLDSRLNSTHNFCLVSPPSKRYTHTARRERHGANCCLMPSGRRGGAINKMNNNLYCHLAVEIGNSIETFEMSNGKMRVFQRSSVSFWFRR